jgi:muramidase (phage lysozyme)
MGLFDDLIPAAAGPPGVPRITVTPGMPPEGRQLLDAIAGSESPGYNVKYGGGTFNDFADHPREAVPIRSGPNTGNVSTAAGRYQFLAPTWDQVKKEADLPDFSPDSQDAGAWYLANKTYQQRTGRDLAQDLQSAKGDHRAIQQIGSALSKVWTSLPGGIEPNRATSSFASRYDGGTNPATDFSAQSRPPAGRIGLFDDLAPQGQVAAPPVSGPPSVLAGGEPAPRVAREGQSEPAPPPTSAMEAGARGVATGVTANFYDELRGLMEAGGLNPKDPASLGALLSGAYKYWTGDPKAAETYDMTAARERGLTQKAEADQPVASIGGNLVGGAVLPVGAAARGATLAERATQGARVGAAVGGLSGVGAGDDTAGRIAGGAVGAGTGAVIGNLAPRVIEGAVQGARAVATPVANAVRSVRNPEGEAARRVTLALERDMRADPNASTRLTPQEFAASVQGGGPATIMDIGGETTRALARSAANTSPEGRQLLNNAINDRFEGQAGRVTNWLNDTFNYPNATAQQQAIEQTAKSINRPAYFNAYKDGDRPIWSPELQRLVGSPDVVDAMRNAAEKGKSRAIADGFGGFNSSVQISPSGVVEFTRGKNGVPTYPNLQFWDYTKRALDDQAKKAARAGADGEAGVLGNLAKQLRSELDNHVDSYAQARAGAAHFFGAENALEAGQNYVMQNFQNTAVRQQLGKMSPTERQLFQDGFVSRFIETLNKVGDRRSILNQIGDNPAAREKLNIVLGPQKATQLEAGMRAEGIMDLARKAVQGNSTTARQLAELGLAGGTYGLATGGDILNPNPTALMNAALVYGAARGRTKINEGLSRKVAEMLTSNDPALLLKGINIVSKNKALLTSMRGADAALARSGAGQAPSVPAFQSMGAGRADDQQANVPGP